MLSISRKDILEHLTKTNQTYRTDKTNATDLFFRNKIRNKLIPYLEKNFNPKIKGTIFDATQSIAEDLALLDDLTEREMEVIGKIGENQEKWEFSVKWLLQLHPAVQRRALLLYIKEATTDLKDIEAAHIEEILKALRSTKGKNQVVVFKRLKLTRKGDRVIISFCK